MTKAFFITGTDTDAGKTYVATQIIKGFNARGYRVSGFKPVAAGAHLHGHQLKNDDALALMAEASVAFEYEDVNPYCFEPAIAPHIAAEQAAVTIDMSRIESMYVKQTGKSDVVIVEGAGGWMVPLNSNEGFDDVAKTLKTPVILVVGLRLGCINHALLTESAILNKGCVLVGWVANTVDAGFDQSAENVATLKKRMQSPYLAGFEYQSKGAEMTTSSQRNLDSLLDYLDDFR